MNIITQETWEEVKNLAAAFLAAVSYRAHRRMMSNEERAKDYPSKIRQLFK